MNLKQEQVLHELRRQLDSIQALDRIDRDTIRCLRQRLEELFSADPYEPLRYNAFPDEWLSEEIGNLRRAQ